MQIIAKYILYIHTYHIYISQNHPKTILQAFSLHFFLLYITYVYFVHALTLISNYLYRISSCKYSRIGCPWRGPNHEGAEHEAHCVHPHRTGADVMEALLDIDARTLEERRLYDNVFDLLSYEKITFNGLYQLLGTVYITYRLVPFLHTLHMLK